MLIKLFTKSDDAEGRDDMKRERDKDEKTGETWPVDDDHAIQIKDSCW